MKTATAPPASEKPLRLYDLSDGRADLFRFDPLMLEPREDWNKREDYGDLEELANNLERNGVITPFIIQKDKGSNRIFINEGNRRWTAITKILIPQGRWPEGENGKPRRPIPCLSEKPGTTPIDRLFMQITCNSGKPFTFLEEARVYQAILAEDKELKPADIARRTGKTKQAISDSLRLVNKGTETLLNAVRESKLAATTALEIVKQAGDEPAEIDRLLSEALSHAETAGRSVVKPKDINAEPEKPNPLKGLKWSSLKQSKKKGTCLLGINNQGKDFQTEHGISLKGLPDGQYINVGWTTQPRGYRFGYYLEGPGAYKAESAMPGLFKNITECADYLIYEIIGPCFTAFEFDHLEKLKAIMIAAAGFPEESEDDDSSESASSEDDESTVAKAASFTLYIVDEAPTEQTKDGRYHETERLVLNDPPEGIEMFHLLSALSETGMPAYGYRLNAHTSLPNPSDAESYDSNPDKGFCAILRNLKGISDVARIAIEEALFDALMRYYPETGTPEEPNHLSFVATSEAEDEKETTVSGYQAILNAPSTNRDGTGIGAGSGGYVSPEKALASIDKALEDLADKEVIPDRMTAVEIALRVIRNESSVTSLKDFLTGKN